MPPTGVIEVTYVYLLHPDEVTDVPEHTCMATGCGYQPRPYRPSNLRMDLWSAPCLVADLMPDPIEQDDITWVTLCGSSDDSGFAFYPADTPRGTYGGNGCLTRFGDRKVGCGPFKFDADD